MTKVLDENGLSYYNEKIQGKLDDKQDTLVSGTNIKTINGNSILGSGDIPISGGGGGGKTHYFVQPAGEQPWGSNTSKRIDFDTLVAGDRYVYYNRDSTSGFYYKYTKRDGTVVDTFTIVPEADNRAIMSDNYTYYRRIEIEVYETAHNVVNDDIEGAPFCKITFYPTSPIKSKTTDNKWYSAAVETIWYGGGTFGMIVFRHTFSWTDSQWIGKVINDLTTRISALENK